MIMMPFGRGAALTALAAALAGLPATAPAESGCGASYTVRPGDTLARIARHCDTIVNALVQANDFITDPGSISVGWELAIPGATASLGPEAEVRPRGRGEAAEAALAEGSYEVRPGDSFASIATALQIPMRDLIAANDGVDPFGLRPGQTLHLPSGSAPPAGDQADDQAGEQAGEQAGGEQAQDRSPGQATGEAVDADAGQPTDDRPTDDRPIDDRPTDDQPAASAPAGGAGQAPPGHGDAASGTGEPATGNLTLEGRVQHGAECPILETPGGEVYSLVSADYGFMPGEYVEIEGETIDMAFCMQGKATVRVTSMTAVLAPQGG